MARIYYAGPSHTAAGVITEVSTLTGLATMLQVATPSTTGIHVLGWGISFDGIVSTDAPGMLPKFEPDSRFKHNVLLFHGEVEGVIPAIGASPERAARIVTQRDHGNRRIVPASEIERLRGAPKAEHTMSARNRFGGIVNDVRIEGLMAQVEVTITEPAVLTAIVTADAVRELGLERGNSVVAVIKSTSVMVEH